MRSALGASLLVVLVVMLPFATAEDFRDPGRVNKVLGNFETPQLRPGESGQLRLRLQNPYTNATMNNLTLTAEIYAFATLETYRTMEKGWTYQAPYFKDTGNRRSAAMFSSLPARGIENLSFTFVSSTSAPYGAPLDQGAYFIRFLLEVDLIPTNGTPVAGWFASRGHFSNEEWANATRAPDKNTQDATHYFGTVNLTYLGARLGATPLLGLIPDTAIGVSEPIPLWPFYLLAGLMVLSAVMAFFYYVEEHPAQFPRAAKGWFASKGKVKSFVLLRRRAWERRKEGES